MESEKKRRFPKRACEREASPSGRTGSSRVGNRRKPEGKMKRSGKAKKLRRVAKREEEERKGNRKGR